MKVRSQLQTPNTILTVLSKKKPRNILGSLTNFFFFAIVDRDTIEGETHGDDVTESPRCPNLLPRPALTELISLLAQVTTSPGSIRSKKA
jgi:hypothetical protein